jgi:apolipoprotein N-acyltransferase
MATIAVGAPTKGAKGTEISMITFQPGLERTSYSKQHLHFDEIPFFTPGTETLVLSQANFVLAPAICYESLQPSHAAQAAESGAQCIWQAWPSLREVLHRQTVIIR